MDLSHVPDWMPFACLITGKLARKPMVTRIIEMLILGIISGGMTAYVTLAKVDTQLQAYIASDQRQHEETNRKLAEIDRCLRERTCTK